MAQRLYENSKVDTLYYHRTEADTAYPCQVRLGDGQIEVRYLDPEGQLVQYFGTELSPGHFKLRADEIAAEATLHMFSGAIVLNGFWVAGGERGMWRIYIA